MLKRLHSFYFFMFMLIAANSAAQRCYPEPVTFNNERVVDTTSYVKNHDDVETEGNAFGKHFKHRDHNNLDYSPAVFNVGKMIDKLYLPVRDKMYADNDCKRKGCLAAVQITHGLVDKKLTLIYEPFYTKLKSITYYPEADSMHYNRYQPTGKKYIYDGSDFIQIQPNQETAFKDLYRKKIIKQPLLNQGPPTDDLDENDVQGVIFSFQEILKFNHAVNGPNAAGYYYCDDMEIHHAAVFHKNRSSSAQKTAKHTLFVTKKNWTALTEVKTTAKSQLKILTPASDDDGANLAHLCPPRCGDLSYPAAY